MVSLRTLELEEGKVRSSTTVLRVKRSSTHAESRGRGVQISNRAAYDGGGPVASGSRVPPWPIRMGLKAVRSRATAAAELMPRGLSTASQPLMARAPSGGLRLRPMIPFALPVDRLGPGFQVPLDLGPVQEGGDAGGIFQGRIGRGVNTGP